MQTFPVIIVGGGPAGTSAGLNLLQAGIECCIIDKSEFPREKLCGGLLTKKSIDLLKEILPPERQNNFIIWSSSQVKIYYDEHKFFNFTPEIPYYLTDRYIFDNELIQEFLARGGTVLQKQKVVNIEPDKNMLELASGEKLKYGYLIGADGANSLTRNYVDDSYSPRGFCVQVDVEKAQAETEAISLYYNLLQNGYGWVFPKSDHLTVGVGGKFNKSLDYKEKLINILKMNDYPYDDLNIKGHFISFGSYIEEPFANDIFLVGDAAGLVDPVFGEGILYALLSGKACAEVIADNFTEATEIIKQVYLDKMQEIHQKIDGAFLPQKLLFNKYLQKVILKLLKKHKGFTSYFSDQVVSMKNYNYNEILKVLYTFWRDKRN